MKDRDWLGRASLWLAFVAMFLICVILGIRLARRPSPPRPRLLVAFLDVGAGDCTLIRSPDGHAALVDTGPAANGTLVAQTLQEQGIHSLDLLVLAVPTDGSSGGVSALLDGGISVRKVWDNAVTNAGAAHQAVLATLHKYQVPVETAHQGDRFLLGARGVRLTVLWPPEHGGRAQTDALVCRLDYGETGIVLAGPADGVEDEYLVANAGAALSCDVLQVAAAGADDATSPELLRRAAPSVAVISSAESTPPGAGTLHRLQAAGAGIWRTDTQGAITVFSNGRSPPAVTAAHL